MIVEKFYLQNLDLSFSANAEGFVASNFLATLHVAASGAACAA